MGDVLCTFHGGEHVAATLHEHQTSVNETHKELHDIARICDLCLDETTDGTLYAHALDLGGKCGNEDCKWFLQRSVLHTTLSDAMEVSARLRASGAMEETGVLRELKRRHAGGDGGAKRCKHASSDLSF